MDLRKEDSVDTCVSEGALYSDEFFRCQFLARSVAQRLPLQATNWSSAPTFEKASRAGRNSGLSGLLPVVTRLP